MITMQAVDIHNSQGLDEHSSALMYEVQSFKSMINQQQRAALQWGIISRLMLEETLQWKSRFI